MTEFGQQTLLGQLLSALRTQTIDSTESSRLSNLASHWLMVLVLGLATAVLIIGSFINFETYFERAFALLVLACPCAMAFGTPLAFSFSMKRAQESGILIKTASVFERLSGIKTVFLDKTGTLTGKVGS